MSPPVAPAMTRAKKCCFCIEMRAGTIAIGWFYVVAAVTGLIVCLVFLSLGNGATTQEVDSKMRMISGRERTTAYISGVIFSTIQLLVALSVVYGCYCEKPGYLIPWLIYAVIFFVFAKAAVIFYTVKFFYGDKSVTGFTGLLALVGIMFGYSAVVVNRYRDTLQERIDNENPEEEEEETSVILLT